MKKRKAGRPKGKARHNYTHHKSYDTALVKKLPNKYQEHWLGTLDCRTKLFFNTNETYQRIILDLGGFENISRIEQSLIERFVYVEFLIRKLESEGTNGDEQEFLETYLKLSNSLNSISAKLGCAKRSSGVSELSKIVNAQKEKEELQKILDED